MVSKISGITTTGDQPPASIAAAIMVDSATTAPTERSIPPVRMTKVMPTASTIRYALSTSRFSTTCAEANPV